MKKILARQLTLKIFMLWPKKNSYKEFDNERKFLRVENSPPPITFLMVGPLAAREENISAWNYTSSKNPLCPLMGAGGRRRSLLHSCFQCSPFSSLVLEIWSFTIYFSGKRRSKHGTRILFPITILFLENIKPKKKCPEMPSKIQTKCAYAPWASYNTP